MAYEENCKLQNAENVPRQYQQQGLDSEKKGSQKRKINHLSLEKQDKIEEIYEGICDIMQTVKRDKNLVAVGTQNAILGEGKIIVKFVE